MIHFAKVNHFHVEQMFANLDKHYEPIKCMKRYMRTTLYNVLITMEEDIRDQVRQEHPLLFMEKIPQFILDDMTGQKAIPEVSASAKYVCA